MKELTSGFTAASNCADSSMCSIWLVSRSRAPFRRFTCRAAPDHTREMYHTRTGRELETFHFLGGVVRDEETSLLSILSRPTFLSFSHLDAKIAFHFFVYASITLGVYWSDSGQ